MFAQPINLYVLWHHSNTSGVTLADMFYKTFCRNPEHPFETSIGIPVYNRFLPFTNGKPFPIDFSTAKRNVVIALIDDDFILDDSYIEYLEEILAQELSNPAIRVIPIALTKYSIPIKGEILKKNIICSFNIQLTEPTKQEPAQYIKTALLHEVAKYLIDIEATSELASPIKLFVSHSKHDETLEFARDFKDYVITKTQLKTFFDVNDIAYGSDFGEVIEANASQCAMVVFHSDSYADREWCRIEALTAKRNNCPIVVVSALQKGEKRSFPYMGNVPTVRLNSNYNEIIDAIIEKVIYNVYKKELLTEVSNLYKLDIDYKLSTMPELFDFINIRKLMLNKGDQFSVVIYPDPPIGSEEMKVLNEMDDNLFFITPYQLPTIEKLQNG